MTRLVSCHHVQIILALNTKSSEQPLWVEQPSNSGRLRLEYEMKRIMYTLSRKRRDKLMSQLEKHNNEIQTLLGNSERLEPMRRKRKSPVIKYFHLIRRQAQSLHSALAHAWQCGDSSAHSAKLVLEKRVGFDEKGGHEIEDSTTIKFMVLFCHGRAAQGLTTTSAICSSSMDWYAAEIESIDSNQDVEQEGFSTSSIGQRPSLLDTQSQRSYCIGSQGTTASDEQSRRVSFLENNAQPASRSVPDDASEISDLCSVLQRSSSQQGLLGYLKDPQERCHSLSLLEHAQLCNSETQRVLSLDEIIGGKDEASGKATLTRRTRLAIAVVLAHSMLQLHTGPWLCEVWGKKDIYFLQDQDGYIHTEQPFVTHLVSSHAMATENALPERSISRACNSSLLSLGILILELWFNERVESLPFRRGFQGPEGKDNEYTDFNTAQKWQEQAMEEAGLDLHNPTRRCIYCAFGAASQDLEDEELRRAVYSEVVQPLEKLLQRFDVKPR